MNAHMAPTNTHTHSLTHTYTNTHNNTHTNTHTRHTSTDFISFLCATTLRWPFTLVSSSRCWQYLKFMRVCMYVYMCVCVYVCVYVQQKNKNKKQQQKHERHQIEHTHPQTHTTQHKQNTHTHTDSNITYVAYAATVLSVTPCNFWKWFIKKREQCSDGKKEPVQSESNFHALIWLVLLIICKHTTEKNSKTYRNAQC